MKVIVITLIISMSVAFAQTQKGMRPNDAPILIDRAYASHIIHPATIRDSIFHYIDFPFQEQPWNYIYDKNILYGLSSIDTSIIITYYPHTKEYYGYNLKIKRWDKIEKTALAKLVKLKGLERSDILPEDPDSLALFVGLVKGQKELTVSNQCWIAGTTIRIVDKKTPKTYIVPIDAPYGIAYAGKYFIGCSQSGSFFLIDRSKYKLLPDSAYYTTIDSIIKQNASLNPLPLLIDNYEFPRRCPGILEQIKFYSYNAQLCRSIYCDMRDYRLAHGFPKLPASSVDSIKSAIGCKKLAKNDEETAYYFLLPIFMFLQQPDSSVRYWKMLNRRWPDSPYKSLATTGGINVIQNAVDSLKVIEKSILGPDEKQWARIEVYYGMFRINWNGDEVSYDMSPVIGMLNSFLDKYPGSRFANEANALLMDISQVEKDAD